MRPLPQRSLSTWSAVGALAAAMLAQPARAGVPADWPALYDPFTLVTLNLELEPADWDTIRFDLTFEIEVPAMFWADGEGLAAIVEGLRRQEARMGEDFSFSKLLLDKAAAGEKFTR